MIGGSKEWIEMPTKWMLESHALWSSSNSSVQAKTHMGFLHSSKSNLWEQTDQRERSVGKADTSMLHVGMLLPIREFI